MELDPQLFLEPTQQWRLETHWVTSPDNAPEQADTSPEYLRLTVTADEYRISDWRELTGLGLDEIEDEGEGGKFYGRGTLEHMLGPERELHCEPASFGLILGAMKVCRKEGYLFSCEFDATVKLDDGKTEELALKAELPFAGVSMNVPINGNAVAIGLARAREEIGSLEIAAGQITPHDWLRKERSDPQAPLDDTRRVLLHTPWRQRLA
ncbi:hypothetical protein [Rariglobus hedericola]|uniref:Uncharacterized protein n=1 Tax=Rariglobus hedericola TaxID=2597822 RepID=A0A556QM91_9BACT|nr:hypothetical protein [Rariglobus hedericola]TSJ77769.1 hypothetical protein FPL22_00220 [Rariglobus hedericola]